MRSMWDPLNKTALEINRLTILEGGHFGTLFFKIARYHNYLDIDLT